MTARPDVAPVLLVGRALEEGWFAVRNPGRAPVTTEAVFTWLRLARDGRRRPEEDGAAVSLSVERIEVFWRSVDVLPPGGTGVVRFAGQGLDELRRQLASEAARWRRVGVVATTAPPEDVVAGGGAFSERGTAAPTRRA